MSLVADTKKLTLAGAQATAEAALNEARRRGVAVTVVVLDHGGEILTAARMDGVSIGGVDVALAKGRCAAKFGFPTAVFAEEVGKGIVAVLGLPNVLPFPGGLPLTVGGAMVGAIGVSGASPDVDGTIATVAAAALD